MAGKSDWMAKQLKDLNVQFDQADTNKSGSLSIFELQAVLAKAGFTGSKKDINKLFFEMDEDKNFQVSKEEFQKVIEKLPSASRREMELLKMFRTMDQNGDGSISKAELSDGAYMDGLGLTEAEINELFSFIFTDKDGKIQYDEFLKLMNFKQSESTLNQLFTKLDKDGSGQISADELAKAINEEGELARVRPQLIGVLSDYEKDHLGRPIDFHRFVTLWMQKKNEFKADEFAANPYI